MIVTCIAKYEATRPERGWTLGESVFAHTPVVPEREYVVYAMALLGLRLVLLLAGDGGTPRWFPAELFRVSNPHLPPDWKYDIRRQDARGLCAIWGYREIVECLEHNDALIESRPDALKIFAGVAEHLPLQAARAL